MTVPSVGLEAPYLPCRTGVAGRHNAKVAPVPFYRNQCQRETLRASTDGVLPEPQGHGDGMKP